MNCFLSFTNSPLFQVNIPLINETKIDVLSEIENIELFPMIWVDESANIDEVSIKCENTLKTAYVTTLGAGN